MSGVTRAKIRKAVIAGGSHPALDKRAQRFVEVITKAEIEKIDVNSRFYNPDSSNLTLNEVELQGDFKWVWMTIPWTQENETIGMGLLDFNMVLTGVLIAKQGFEMIKTAKITGDFILKLNGIAKVIIGFGRIATKIVCTVFYSLTLAAQQAAGKVAGLVSSILGSTLSYFMAFPYAFKCASGARVLNLLKGKDQSFVDGLKEKLIEYEQKSPKEKEDVKKVARERGGVTPEELKSVAPNAYAKLLKGEQVKLEDLHKEIKATMTISGIAAGIFIVAAVTGVVGMFLTAGVAPLILAVIGMIAGVASTALDGMAVVDILKKMTKLGKKDLIVKIITITVAVLTIALTIAFPPASAAVLACSLLVSGFILAVPVGSIIYLKIKEARLDEEVRRKKQEALDAQDNERARLEMLRHPSNSHEETLAAIFAHEQMLAEENK